MRVRLPVVDRAKMPVPKIALMRGSISSLTQLTDGNEIAVCADRSRRMRRKPFEARVSPISAAPRVRVVVASFYP